jgi:hypothetical protein
LLFIIRSRFTITIKLLIHYNFYISTSGPGTIQQPHVMASSINIPIHVNGDHWTAVHWRCINGRMPLFYADDLNNPRTEKTVRDTFFSKAEATIPTPSLIHHQTAMRQIIIHHISCGSTETAY